MPQDSDSGAAGNAFGRTTAPKIAAAIGAKMVGRGSNEAPWNGRRIVIKSARSSTSSIGVTYRMLEYLDAVVAGFENPDGSFDLFELSPNTFKKLMSPTRSNGASSGRVGIVARQAIRESGNSLANVRLR
jgi:hypothetical protein